MASIIKVNEIQDAGSNTIISSDGSGTFTLSSALTNTPTFKARLSADQTISASTETKLQWDTEVWDTNSAFDSTTNYRFTVPSGEGGKYFFITGVASTNIPDGTWVKVEIIKNGTDIEASSRDTNAFTGLGQRTVCSCVTSAVAGDYFEVFYTHNSSAGNEDVFSYDSTYFSGFKLIGA